MIPPISRSLWWCQKVAFLLPLRRALLLRLLRPDLRACRSSGTGNHPAAHLVACCAARNQRRLPALACRPPRPGHPDWRPVTSTDMNHLSERLFRILSQPDFLSMKGQANDVPIFILPYEPEQEDAASRMVESLPANPGDAIARRAEHRAMCQASGVSRAGFFRGWWSRGLLTKRPWRCGTPFSGPRWSTRATVQLRAGS